MGYLLTIRDGDFGFDTPTPALLGYLFGISNA